MKPWTVFVIMAKWSSISADHSLVMLCSTVVMSVITAPLVLHLSGVGSVVFTVQLFGFMSSGLGGGAPAVASATASYILLGKANLDSLQWPLGN